jgi:ABC-type Fe3+/spermidine/putrescine transport system ATPase subunit
MPGRATGESARPLVQLRELAKSYGGVTAVKPLHLDVAYGDFCAILGPSGCGKSTLLRMIAGFVEPTGGRIEIDGIDVTGLGPEQRPTNMVFQGYGLFPHLSVAENVGFGLALKKMPRPEIAARVADALRLVRLEGFGDRMIDRLSGGQQQRVALARALIMRPKVLLLDEPLAALDLKLRHAMQEELRSIHAEIGGTFIFVTHDQTEAFALASRIVVMNEGRIEQVGTPQDIYLDPSSLFVADFVGETNALAGTRVRGCVQLAAGARFESPGAEGAVRAIIRPEAVRQGAGEITVQARITDVVFLGNALKIVASLPSGETLSARDPDVRRYGHYVRDRNETFGWSPADQRILEGAR